MSHIPLTTMLQPVLDLVERFISTGTEGTDSATTLMIRRTRGFGLVALATVTLFLVHNLIFLGPGRLLLIPVAMMAAVIAAMALSIRAKARSFRLIVHAGMAAMLLGVTVLTAAIGYVDPVSLTYPILIVIATNYILGIRAAAFWTFASVVAGGISLFNSHFPTPVAGTLEMSHSSLFFAFALIMLSIFCLSALERRFSDQQTSELEFLARHDPLTSLFNRRAIEPRLQESIARGNRYHRRLALIAIDLDGFKKVNDTYGHAVGDALLVSIGQRIGSMTRTTDAACRIGGDEFVILVDDIGEDKNVIPFAERLLERILLPIEIGSLTLRVGASMGLATFPESARDATALFREADHAMYMAKESGGGRIFFRGLADLPIGPEAHAHSHS